MDSQVNQSPAATIPRRPSSTDTSQIGLGPPPSSAKSNASPLPPTPSASTTAGAPSNLPPPSVSTPPSANQIPGAMGSPVRPPLNAPRPPHNLVDQRRQFLTSLISFNKQRNLKIPPEIVNGERDGAIKMGDTWVEVVELFMAVLRVGGMDKVCIHPLMTLTIGIKTIFRLTILARFLAHSKNPQSITNTHQPTPARRPNRTSH